MEAMNATKRRWWIWSAAAIGAVIALMVLGQGVFVIGDTEEDIWPDPRDRQGVHLRLIARSVAAYATEHGYPPDSLPMLLAGLPPDEYRARASRLTDLWAMPLKYKATGPVYELRSAGPDRAFGTDDDIWLRDGTTYASKRALENSTRGASPRSR